MHKAVFLDLGSTSHDDLDLSRLHTACGELTSWNQTRLEQRLQHIQNADIIISNKVILDAEILEQLQGQIKLICIAATGTNNVDLNAAKALNIPVTNIRDYASQSVAEHVMALIFALYRQLPSWQHDVPRGAWSLSPHFCLLNPPIRDIAGATLGIVGYGVLGQAVAAHAQALGMQVIVAERPTADSVRAGYMAFDDVLAQADIISLHCPLSPETANLFDAQRLQQMKAGAILINTARGGIVDEIALLQALQSGHLAGAGMDVLAQEPPPADHPLLHAQLPNLLITPHVAWASRSARQTLINQLAEIIERWQHGDILNRVA